MNPLPKFVFFGTPEVASNSLALLKDAGIVPSLIVTNPDAPRGRGHHRTPSPVKAWALANNVPVLTPDKISAECIAEIAAHQFTFAVVIAYGKIFPQALIDIFPNGVINVHYSLLPKYRGATPLETALIWNEPIIGVTLQRMVLELDAGDILAQKFIQIGIFETAKFLRPKLTALGVDLLVSNLSAVANGTAEFTPQESEWATSTRKLKKEDGRISLDDDPVKNWTIYRAYNDTIGTYFIDNGLRVKVTHAESNKEGEMFIRRVIPEGKKEMTYEEYRAWQSRSLATKS